MTENRDEFIARMKAEGNWDAARGWIRNTQKRIKQSSKHPPITEIEATSLAYEQAMLRWPSTGADRPEEDIVHIAATKGSMDVARDVEWAYNHLNDQRVRADQAPSAGAWNMLIYGRESRHKFIELVGRYDSQQQKEQEKEAEELGKETADHIKALQKLRAITKKVHRDSIRDSIRQCPDVVVEEMRKASYVVVEPRPATQEVNTSQTREEL